MNVGSAQAGEHGAAKTEFSICRGELRLLDPGDGDLFLPAVVAAVKGERHRGFAT